MTIISIYFKLCVNVHEVQKAINSMLPILRISTMIERLERALMLNVPNKIFYTVTLIFSAVLVAA